MLKKIILSLVVVVAIVLIFRYLPQNQSIISPETTPGQKYVDTDSNFSYTCPTDWSLLTNLNYDGQVKTSECTKIYSGQISFDDGASIVIGFVPQTVADTVQVAGGNFSDIILNDVKGQENVQVYSNNNFVGWYSLKNPQHTFQLIARLPATGGYYEIQALAMGDTKTDQEYKQMIDAIVATFQSEK